MKNLKREVEFIGNAMLFRAPRAFRAVALGVSTGGVSALKRLLGGLPADFPLPLLVVAHLTASADDGLAVLLDRLCAISVKEADEGELLRPATVYIAPANYHLLVEKECRLALSVHAPVNFARPSIDVLFESAALAFGTALVGVLLTGAGADGSRGLLRIQQCGGRVIVQDPVDAEMPAMPESALRLLRADHLLALAQMPALLQQLAKEVP
jgi:two-component system chemotaxis response regulator CheB